MTRKDYVLIADAIAVERQHWDHLETATQALDALARTMCVSLRLGNPRFDRERFLKACGVQ